MSEDRRGSPRYPAYYAGELHTAEGRHSIAITRDVGASGLLLLSRRTHAVGDVLKLQMIWDGQPITLEGKVVRHEAMDPKESELWRTKVAVAISDGAQLAKLYEKLKP
jgi:hypothetical protein